MKIYLLGAMILLLVATVCAKFKEPKANENKMTSPPGYYIYNKSGSSETDITNYSPTVFNPGPCPGTGPNLCWIYLPISADVNGDGNITQLEFYNYVHWFLDLNQNGVLHDEMEISGRLEKSV